MNRIKQIAVEVATLQKKIKLLEAEKKKLIKEDGNNNFYKYYDFYVNATPSIAFLASTDGQGLYTKHKIKNLKCFFDFTKEDLKEYNQVNVFFDTKAWNYDKYNIIYTDKTFQNCVRNKLKELGLKNWNKIGYSEAGMQSNNAVNFDMSVSLAKESYIKIYKNNPLFLESPTLDE
jgi:hypothetical protein